MCGPTVGWEWLVLDVSYVLFLIGGAMVLRAKRSSVFTWIAFGVLSTFVGGFLFSLTWVFGPALAAAATPDTAESLLASC